MAAQTPVTIDSSPPNDAYQIPSITPDGIRQNVSTGSMTRSSPQLLSPSAFVRPRAQPLKSGSRAQKVPTSANAGFSSAASIWKLQSKDQDVHCYRGLHGDGKSATEDKSESEKPKAKTKSSGKLSRPKKTTKAQKDTSSAFRENRKQPSAEFDGPQQSAVGRDIAFYESHKDPDALYSQDFDRQLPYMSLVEPVVDTDAISAKPGAPSTELPVKHKRRKRAPKDHSTAEKPAQKKPRKSQAKSEAIILDSDEPEITLDEAQADDMRAAKKLAIPSATKSRPRTVKAPSSRNSKHNAISFDATEATESTESAPFPAKYSAEASAYFAQLELAAPSDQPSPPSPQMAVVEQSATLEATRSVCEDDVVEDLEINNASNMPAPAPRRRRSWTPIQDSHGGYSAHSIPAVDCSLDEEIGQIKFSEMLGNFSYLDPKAEAAPGPTSNNAVKKNTVTAAEIQCQSISAPPTASGAKPASKPPKKSKAPKKPQTITSLATAAYQPTLQTESAQSTVSEFFAPRKEREESTANGVNESDKAVKEPAEAKKPRKSRAKVKTAEGDASTKRNHTKAQTKKNGKVKLKPADHQPPLYSPTQARKQMRSQDFLFGTSSQLAAEESPEFIREVQHAIRQSEMTSGLPDSSQVCTQAEVSPRSAEKSYTRVPTAPHGTCLSVEQATRELWCVSARDETGSKLIHEAKNKSDDNASTQLQPDTAPMGRPELPHESPNDFFKGHVSNLPFDQAPARPLEGVDQNKNFEVPQGEMEQPALVAQARINGEGFAPQGTEWVFLPSDDSEFLPHDPISKSANQPVAHNALGSVKRPALQPLDANLNMAIHDVGSKSPTQPQVRPLSTAAVTRGRQGLNSQPLESPDDLSLAVPKRSRGRPRKEGSADRTPLTSPARGRGRPRKQSLTRSISKTSPTRPRGRPRKESTTEKEPTPKRPVGRPRKHPISTTSPRQPSKERSPQHPISASQLASRKEWTNIDDISDSDSPKTPSPRRRRASSSPSSVRTLDFEGRQSPCAKSKVPIASGGMKATDPEWPVVQGVIYPKIAQTIKSTPPSTDLKDPSWHEKILLYHPIVLEDLTAWLNKQGLRTHFQRLKPKVKQRGRKKKDAPPEVDEWETIEGELKAWMVQKWCEDHSICCLWKDGLRGGVKTRY